MIKNIKTNFKRTGKTVRGKVLLTEFLEAGKFCLIKQGRGYSRFRINDKFLISSTKHPKICFIGNEDDYVLSLHIWGTNKAMDNIEVAKKFPNIEIAKEFMKFINKFNN